ncbi:hypothetical protein BUE80_DR008688 [Diplocarpon rosae]|nr:hypothetical protein BUE80_DR008688 [Diplocarpon rosae]
MATAPSNNSFGLHLCDRALTPVVSSSRRSSSTDSNSASRRQSQALAAFTAASITAYDTASRLGLGLPQRVMVETWASGPIALTSYLQSSGHGRAVAEHAPDSLQHINGTFDESRETGDLLANGTVHAEVSGAGESENKQQNSPLLIASVIASSSVEIGEARRAAAKLERTGRDFQREWALKQDQESMTREEG